MAERFARDFNLGLGCSSDNDWSKLANWGWSYKLIGENRAGNAAVVAARALRKVMNRLRKCMLLWFGRVLLHLYQLNDGWYFELGFVKKTTEPNCCWETLLMSKKEKADLEGMEGGLYALFVGASRDWIFDLRLAYWLLHRIVNHTHPHLT